MKHTNCPQEAAVSKAVRSGEWEDSLRTHAAECAVCREVAQASCWMRSLTQDAGANALLPDAGVLWWRAQLSERQAEVEKACEAMEWAEIVSLALASVGLVVWAFWNWQALQPMAAWLDAVLSPEAWGAAYDAASSMPISFWSIVAILSLAAIFLAYPILAED